MSENINGGCYDRLKREGKRTFVIGSSFDVPWFVFGFSLVFDKEQIYKVQGKGILKIVRF